MINDALHQQWRRLRRLNDPRPAVAGRHRGDRRHRDHGHLHLDRGRRHRQRLRGSRGPDQDVDLVLLGKLAGIARGGRRVGPVVELNDADLLTADLSDIGLAGSDPLGVRNPDR